VLFRRALIAFGLAAAALALFLAASGGFLLTTPVGRVSARSPIPAAVIAVLALLAAAVLGRRAWSEDLARVLVWLRRRAFVLAVLLALLTVATGLALSSRVAAGSDSYGYVSQALLWRDGSLLQEEPLATVVPWPHATFTLTPLGYRPSDIPGVIVPVYPPGLPLLMAGAHAIGGFEAMFLVVPLMGGAAVLLTFGLGRRLAGVGTGLAASALLATHPTFVFQLLQPMSDVPATALWAAVALIALKAGARGALLAGLFASLAVIVRPNLVPLAAVTGAWLIHRRFAQAPHHPCPGREVGAPPSRAAGSDERLTLSRSGPPIGFRRRTGGLAAAPALWFALGLVPGVALLLGVNWHLSGHPLVTGYGDAADFYAIGHVPQNLSGYVTWLADTHGWVVLAAPVAAAWFVLAPWRGLGRPAVIWLALLWLLVVGSYLPFLVFGDWSFLRMLLPGFPFALVLGTAAVVRLASLCSREWGALGAAALVAALCGLHVAVAQRAGVFDVSASQGRYRAVADHVAASTASDAIVLAHHHSGSIRLYAGRTTVRWDVLEPHWLDPLIEWCRLHGREVWLVLDVEEEDAFRRRFDGASTLAALDWPPRADTMPRGHARVYAPPDRADYLAGRAVVPHLLDLTDRRSTRLTP
jgi:hypothetical protein